LPAFMGTLLIVDFEQIVANWFNLFRAKAKNLSFRFLLWGIALVIFTQILALLGLFRGFDLALAEYFIPWEAGRARVKPLAVVLPCPVQSDYRGQFSSQSMTVVEQLKAAGAKAVMVDYRLMGWFESKRLMQTGIAVVGIPYGTMMTFGVQDIPTGHYSLDLDFARTGSIHRLLPRLSTLDTDITLELIKKYRGYPDDMAFRKVGNKIVFGEYSIPVSRNGWVCLNLGRNRYSRDLVAPVSLYQNRETGELGLWEYSLPKTDTSNYPLIGRYSGYFRDRAVLLVPSGDPGFGGIPSMLYTQWYAMAFTNMLRQEYVIESSWLHLVLAAVFLLLFGIICRFVKPSYAFPLLIALTAGSFLFGHWLFHVQNMFIELTAFVGTLSLAAFIFPALRFAHDVRKASEALIAGEEKGSAS